jgi:hypothetical protein
LLAAKIFTVSEYSLTFYTAVPLPVQDGHLKTISK